MNWPTILVDQFHLKKKKKSSVTGSQTGNEIIQKGQTYIWGD